MAKYLDNNNFIEEVINFKGSVLVDFFATWCGPCKMLAPVIDNLYEKFNNYPLIGKVDIDESPEIAQKYEVMSVPTLIFFKNGKEIRRETGFIPQEKLEEMIKSELL